MEDVSPLGPINISEVGTAPNRPGIYVWYARPDIAKADWHSEFAGGPEKASQNLQTLIRKHSMKHGSQGMVIEATAQFSNRWRGTLAEVTEARFGEFSSMQPIQPQARLSKLCDEDATRGALVALLQACFPIFTGPLYIGLAINQPLRKRLLRHSQAFHTLWNSKATLDDTGDQTTFAARAYKAGFSPGELFCYAIPIDTMSTGLKDPQQVQELIETIEWLLNRWSLPSLGKQ